MLHDLPAATLTIYPGLGQALGYSGLHTLWLGVGTVTTKFYVYHMVCS